MFNLLQRSLLATTTAALTLGTTAVRAGEVSDAFKPSPTHPNDNSATTLVVPAKAAFLPSSSPTNPNPPPDRARRSLAKFLFVAQVPNRQIAQRQEQPSNTSSKKRPPANNDTRVLNEQLEESRQAQNESEQNLRNRKPLPGGE